MRYTYTRTPYESHLQIKHENTRDYRMRCSKDKCISLSKVSIRLTKKK